MKEELKFVIVVRVLLERFIVFFVFDIYLVVDPFRRVFVKLVHDWDNHLLSCFSEKTDMSNEKFGDGLVIFFLAEVMWLYDVTPIILKF